MRTILTAVVLAVLWGCGSEAVDASSRRDGGARAQGPTSDMDRLLAPIALYPDQLIAQMLLCAGTPATVTELDAWLMRNASLKGTDLQDAATIAGFEPSFVALAVFPQVVTFMAERLDWTTQLGQAFAANKSAVFDSIQKLRRQAEDSGALKDTPQQQVETKSTSSGQQVIVIEPANPQVVYVPQYDPQVVYVEDDDDGAEAAVAGLIGFTAGIAIGAAVDNDYYYGPYGWHGGVYMHNDGWDDWYDAREDAREDWMDHREDVIEERGDLARDVGEERTERAEQRGDVARETGAQRTERAEDRQGSRAQTQPQREERAGTTPRASSSAAPTSQTRSSGSQTVQRERSGTRSDAFSGYSSGRSERAASARGQQSRGGGGSRGGGRRR